MRRSATSLSVLALLVLSAAFVLAGPKRKEAKPWARAKAPAEGPPRSIGKYGAGCIRGATALSLDGRGFHVARPWRNKHYGHPELVDFIRDLARRLDAAGHGVLLVGDLGQPRGGPAPSGHSSHQTGLDADIWYWHPKRAEKDPLRRRERRKLRPRAVVSQKRKKKTRFWSAKVIRALELAASDDRIARIFVNPVVKRELCAATEGDGADRGWLRKIRPWWGHSHHFHVRLACPEDSPACEPQDPVPPGDGCDDVEWWLDDQAQAERRKGRRRYGKKVRSMPELPEACAELID